jgi:hypothetical protein
MLATITVAVTLIIAHGLWETTVDHRVPEQVRCSTSSP